jgi:hypothetical protein
MYCHLPPIHSCPHDSYTGKSVSFAYLNKDSRVGRTRVVAQTTHKV